MTSTPRKGDTVFYTNSAGTFSARVESVHRDGTFTVTALFPVYDGKEVHGGYLGFKYRVDADILRPTL